MRLAAALAGYLAVELWRYWRFRRLLGRLRVRCYGHRGGRTFISWVRSLLQSKEAPVCFDREVFERYTQEGPAAGVGYGGGNLDWHRIYAWWAWGCGRPFDAPDDPELHADLLECASASCLSLGLEGPPPDAPAPRVLQPSPFGYGVCEIRATFKPLPLRVFLRSVHSLTRLSLSALGMRRVTEYMPGGKLVCWTNLPQGGQKLPGTPPPVVFLHGLGLGNFTYLPLLAGPCGREWRTGGIIMVELPCMVSSMSDLEKQPQVLHFADALGRVLREQFGRGDGEYDIVCHSLSSYLAATLNNEGSPCRPRRTVLIDPVCFLEGVEVCSRFPFRTPEECRKFAEATVLFPPQLPMAARRLMGQIFRQLVCRDIFTQYSVLRWNGTDGCSVLWRNTSAEVLVCLSDDDHFLPADRVARHCEVHFPKARIFRMPGKDHGSFVIENDLRRKLLGYIADYLAEGV